LAATPGMGDRPEGGGGRHQRAVIVGRRRSPVPNLAVGATRFGMRVECCWCPKGRWLPPVRLGGPAAKECVLDLARASCPAGLVS